MPCVDDIGLKILDFGRRRDVDALLRPRENIAEANIGQSLGTFVEGGCYKAVWSERTGFTQVLRWVRL